MCKKLRKLFRILKSTARFEKAEIDAGRVEKGLLHLGVLGDTVQIMYALSHTAEQSANNPPPTTDGRALQWLDR